MNEESPVIYSELLTPSAGGNNPKDNR